MSFKSSACEYCTLVAAAMAWRSSLRSGAVAASLAAAAVLPRAAPPAVSATSSTAKRWNSAAGSAATALATAASSPAAFGPACFVGGRARAPAPSDPYRQLHPTYSYLTLAAILDILHVQQ